MSLTKDFFWDFHNIHLNAAYYGGGNLDRFSQYQFGIFDEHRIHGVPSAGVRFSELRMFRASYAVNLFDQYRAELFFDHAGGHDRHAGPEWHRINGVGIGLSLSWTAQDITPRGHREEFLARSVSKPWLARRSDTAPQTAVSHKPVRPHPTLDRYFSSEEERPRIVREMFDAGAPSYEWICRIMSFGTGEWYRASVLREAGLRDGSRLLDVGTGTGPRTPFGSDDLQPDWHGHRGWT